MRKEPFAFTVTKMRILLGSSNEPELNSDSGELGDILETSLLKMKKVKKANKEKKKLMKMNIK